VAETEVSFVGTLDLATVSDLTEQVEAVARDYSRIVLNLSALEFVDSTGVRGLLTLKQEVAAAGRTLVIRGLKQEILYVLEILGVKEMLVGESEA
jgi:anti-anti-sigma factor